MIMPGAEIKVMVATKPVDFRRQVPGVPEPRPVNLPRLPARRHPRVCVPSDDPKDPEQCLTHHLGDVEALPLVWFEAGRPKKSTYKPFCPAS